MCVQILAGKVLIGLNKKNTMFRVTGPYLNLLVKLRFFLGFLEKNIMLCILKGELPFKMHEIIFFPRNKNMCA